MKGRNKTALTLLALHLLLMVYSASGILSKNAAKSQAFSWPWLLLMGGVFLILAVYAVGWQQVIKRLPLTTAFANKAVTVVWGIVWGALFFKEAITPGKLLGAALIIAGVVLFVKADGEEMRDEK
ncbi:DMT family transporter [Allofournierella sp.]|uniref:DMT family transporter n=1 Tax=Allofournierella sp. TaxID=1940256 RepID=UPI003AB64790